MQNGGFQTSLNWCDICEHSNRLEDEREGHTVCVDCGLVLQPIYLHPKSTSTTQSNDTAAASPIHRRSPPKKDVAAAAAATPRKRPGGGKVLREEEEDLFTLCDKLQLCFDVVQEVLRAWEPVKKWWEKGAATGMGSKKHSKRGLIVMVIYQILIEQNIPRPISHLCQEAGIHPDAVWFWSKMFYRENETEEEKIVDPARMCEYFLKPLNLPFHDIREIQKAASQHETLSFAPKTLLATCAYMFLKKKRGEGENKNKYSIQKLGKILGVSVMSMYRCNNYILKEKKYANK